MGQGPRRWQQSSALASQTSAPPLGWAPTHRQEVGGLQPDGLVAGGRDDGGLGLGCRGGSDDLGPGQDLELEGFGAQWVAILRPPSLPPAWGSTNLGLGLRPPQAPHHAPHHAPSTQTYVWHRQLCVHGRAGLCCLLGCGHVWRQKEKIFGSEEGRAWAGLWAASVIEGDGAGASRQSKEASAAWVLGRPEAGLGLAPTFHLLNPRSGRKQASSSMCGWDSAPGSGDLPPH